MLMLVWKEGSVPRVVPHVDDASAGVARRSWLFHLGVPEQGCSIWEG